MFCYYYAQLWTTPEGSDVGLKARKEIRGQGASGVLSRKGRDRYPGIRLILNQPKEEMRK
jgi:hypothetical protein